MLPGKVGGILRQRARGIDRAGSEPSSERVSLSNEETFPKDIADRERLEDELRGCPRAWPSYLQRTGDTAAP